MNLDKKHIEHPFKVPENYFVEFEERVLAEQKLIAKFGNKSPFITNENYFDRLEHTILTQTVQKPQKNIKQFYFAPFFKYAAAILVFFSIGYLGYKEINKQPDYSYNDLNSEEIIAYFESQPNVGYFLEDNISNIDELNGLGLMDVTDQDLEEFLIPE